MKSFAEIDIENGGDYLKLLAAVSKLSGLFSDSSIPLIHYRAAENIFCKSFSAKNLSRSDTAFDADYKSIGIGLKTFRCTGNNKLEKIAEFNQLSSTLKELTGKKLALQLATFRNERIDLPKRLYAIQSSLYHIVARDHNELILFETDYEKIDIPNIRIKKQNQTTLQFDDGKNLYSFNFSKSTLFRRFEIPDYSYRLPVDILDDPYTLLLQLFEEDINFKPASQLIRGVNYVVLPLYGRKGIVYEKSGLNAWNAGGRKRDLGEVYISIPIEIRSQFPNFFPKKDVQFDLQIPTNEVFTAKVCQQGGKALMTNPNKALSDWLLRKILQLKAGELATNETLDKLGFDSVLIIKESSNKFKIDIMSTNSYETFINTEA